MSTCPMCDGTGKAPRKPTGLWVAEGDVEDVRAVYRFAGVEDLGARSRGRGAGSTAREDGGRDRAGRAQARDRRTEEHA